MHSWKKLDWHQRQKNLLLLIESMILLAMQYDPKQEKRYFQRMAVKSKTDTNKEPLV